MRDNQYTVDGRIRFSEVDHTRRITLPGLVNYFQDCSTFQSEDLGLGIEHCGEKKRAWILSSWQVVTERYPEIGEKIKTSTWATDFNGLFGERNFCMTDEKGQDVAYANSLWVYMNVEKGRPVRPEESEIAPYGVGDPYEMEYESRKITLPEKTEALEKLLDLKLSMENTLLQKFPNRKCITYMVSKPMTVLLSFADSVMLTTINGQV